MLSVRQPSWSDWRVLCPPATRRLVAFRSSRRARSLARFNIRRFGLKLAGNLVEFARDQRLAISNLTELDRRHSQECDGLLVFGSGHNLSTSPLLAEFWPCIGPPVALT